MEHIPPTYLLLFKRLYRPSKVSILFSKRFLSVNLGFRVFRGARGLSKYTYIPQNLFQDLSSNRSDPHL